MVGLQFTSASTTKGPTFPESPTEVLLFFHYFRQVGVLPGVKTGVFSGISEGRGFEPPVQLPVRRFSNLVRGICNQLIFN